MKKNYLVGLSGGIDSAVTAFLLKQAGHNVIGVTMTIWKGEYKPSKFHSCYGANELEEVETAREIANQLSIPYYVIDCADEYEKLVLSDFKNEYKNGRTPNPCVRCNHMVKLGILPQQALKQGIPFDYFATGHYANIGLSDENRLYIYKGINNKKDQSYFLYKLSQQQLSMLAFPLGKLNKSDVRQIALNNNLKVDISKESQDFYAGNYSELLKFDERIGEILHENGTKMGIHKGIWNFTIGQRKGIGISHPTPLYVTRLDAVKNIIYVGEKEYLNTHSFKLKDIHYMHSYKLSINDEFTVKTRSSGIEVSCTISGINMNEIEVELHASPGAIAPGQSAVFYSKEIVEFGGVIY